MPSSDTGGARKGHVKKGRAYERRAAEFLQQQGFDILDRNYQAGHKEIDLVAACPGLIVFVEVKAAVSKRFGHPAAWIDHKKRENLIAAAHQYIAEHDLHAVDLRFDVITFTDGRLEHYPDAFAVE